MQKRLHYLWMLLLMAVAGSVSAADTWVQTSLNDLEAGQTIVLVDLNTSTAATNDNGTQKAPAVNAVTIAEGKLTSAVADNLIWEVEAAEEGGWRFKVPDTSNYIYCTNSNNGVRVGENDDNVFTIASNDDGIPYLYHKGMSRYIGVYNAKSGPQDWRCYTTINANIRDCRTVAFVKTTDSSTGTTTTTFKPTFSPAAGEVEAGTTVTITANDEWIIASYLVNGTETTVNAKTATLAIDQDTRLTVNGQNSIDRSTATETINYTIKEEVPTSYETVTLPYEEALIYWIGKFKFEGDDGWISNSYGAVVGGKNITSWLVSPIVDATENAAPITLTFEHQGRYFTTPEEEATLWVREEGGDWTQLDIEYTDAFTGKVWTTFSEVTVDLSDYAGKKFQIGFKYTSTDNYGTWEVKNVKIQAGEVIEKQDADLSFDVENFTATIGEDNEFPVLNNPNALEVTYRSTYTDIATVDSEGNITLKAAGQTTIFAEFAGNEAFKEGNASYLLVVKEQVIAGTDRYALVTDVGTLSAEDEIILVGTSDEETFFALSPTQNTNNRAANKVSIEDDGTIIPGNDIEKITLKEDADFGFMLQTSTGYLYAASSSSNWLRTEEEADANAYVNITIDEETGDATIVFQGSNTHNNMRFNPNNGNPMFACYASTSTIKNMPRIYRKVVDEPATWDITINKYGLATFYWSDKTFTLPEGLTAATYRLEDNKLTPGTIYENLIPAGDAVVVKGTPGETYTLVETDGSDLSRDTANRLSGLDEEGSVENATAVFKYYWLGANDGVVGFYYGAANGAPFTLGAHKAYLALSEDEAQFASFVLFDGTATGINSIEQGTSTANGAMYNLSGQRVSAQYKGVVIVNGKKQIRK